MNDTVNEKVNIGKKPIFEDVFANAQRVDEKTHQKAMAKQINVNTTFKWVRYGLSMLFTALILCLFSLFYVKPGDAPFYVCILTLAFVAVGFVVVITTAKKAGKSYLEHEKGGKKRGKDE